MEQLARQNKSQVLTFIQAQVGYSSGDSADVLSRTGGGVRFLCFAAILVSWGATHVGLAELSERLIRNSSREDQPLSTIHQLVDLLGALQSKLMRSGFGHELLGRNLSLRRYRRVSLKSNDPLLTPGQDGIKARVDALRYCSRIEEESFTHIDSSRSLIPWAIAFVKWFLDSPPEVRGAKGILLLDAYSFDVSITESTTQERFLVSTYHKFDNLRQLLAPQGYAGPYIPLSLTFSSGTLNLQFG